MKRLVGITVAVMLAAGGACSSDRKEIAYRPVAFGENNQCYYANNPLEAHQLIEAGLCERSWAPTPMPLYWHERYYPYYSSPAYYNVYVPAQARTTYAQHEKSWGAINKKGIATEAVKATYKASNGKTVTAEKIGATKYGAGNRFGPPGAKFGGGARNAPAPEPVVAETPKPKTDAPKAKPAAPTKPTPQKSPPKASTPKSPTPKSPSPKSPSGGFGGGSRGGRR